MGLLVSWFGKNYWKNNLKQRIRSMLSPLCISECDIIYLNVLYRPKLKRHQIVMQQEQIKETEPQKHIQNSTLRLNTTMRCITKKQAKLHEKWGSHFHQSQTEMVRWQINIHQEKSSGERTSQCLASFVRFGAAINAKFSHHSFCLLLRKGVSADIGIYCIA